uniref:Uncharacterized protein n=1 Tax=Siphoviridae sp. ctWsj12 TaxID=2826363 RepID=A0A8S5NS79_9CAUD|nr:MAG TPA: hypothetical protein [Siphoviridae sp. ctWsj12]
MSAILKLLSHKLVNKFNNNALNLVDIDRLIIYTEGIVK